ncbi:MAG: nitroreductase family protein [Bacteroidales bacterium]|nr:nitroreductase family protein [Bacteroidales bacterium]
MEDFHELLKRRRSIRKYTDEPISAEDVKTILEAALMAPAGKRQNPWQFIAVEDKETLKRLSVAKEHGARPIEGASLAIVVVCDSTIDTWVEDGSIASILIQLQCEALGLGSCWIQMNKRFTSNGQSAEDAVREILGIPYQMEVLSVISIGHKAEEKKPFDEEKLQWEKVHIGKW